MTDDGFGRTSREEFIRLLAEQRGGGMAPPEPPPPDEPEFVVDPPPGASLEERLAAAQAAGLADNLRRQLAFVGPAERVFEFQALGVKRYPNDSFDRSRAAHARGPEEAITICAQADAWTAHGIYILPARLRSGVESRHAAPGNWFDIAKGGGTTDSDVEARLILAVDFDVVRPSGISATEEEMHRSVRVAENAWRLLAHHLGETSLAYLHSGNGRQIHIALDAIPTTDETKFACAGLLTGLARLFNTAEVKVDEKLYDSKRILPACGTLKKKGAPGVDDRPHRRTAIVTPDPGSQTRVPLGKLVELARHLWEIADPEGRAAIEKSFGVKPQSYQAASVVTGMRPNPGSPYDLANAVEPQAVAEWLGLYNARGEVVCPGCGETSGVAVLNHGLKCHHNRCSGRGRSGFRTNIDLVAEVRGVSPREAVAEIGERFGLDPRLRAQPADAGQPPPPPPDPGQQAAPAPAPSPTTGPFALPQRFVKLTTTEVFAPLPPVNWLVKDLHLVTGRPTLIAGYGFSGKTLIAQALLLAVASGHPVWGKYTPTSPVVGWHLDYEQGSYATRRRYQRLAHGHGIPREALAERLQVTVFPDVYLDSPDAVDAYARAVEGVSMVVLDALRGATPTMDENDSTIRRCLDNLSRISEKTGTAFVVLHHAGKTRDGETSDPRKIPRGSSAIFDACGCVLAVEGEKNEPKLVVQTKAPAEAEGNALDDFYVTIEDVADETGPTTGLRVLHKEAAETKVQVATTKAQSLRDRIVETIRMMPGQLRSGNDIFDVVGGNRGKFQSALSVLVDDGVVVQPTCKAERFSLSTGTAGTTGTGAGVVLVPGTPPFRGVPVAGEREKGRPVPVDRPGGDPPRFNLADVQRAQQAEEDADRLEPLDPRQWKSTAAQAGWNLAREGRARAIAKARLEKTRSDWQALHAVALRGDDPRAWATERGWDDDRIRAAMRHESAAQPPSPSSVPRSVEVDPDAESDANEIAHLGPEARAAYLSAWPPYRRERALAVLAARELPAGPASAPEPSAPPAEPPAKARKKGRPNPAYQDPRALEVDATELLAVIGGEDGMTLQQIETSPKVHWKPADVEVLLKHLLDDGRLVEESGQYRRQREPGED